MLKLIGNAKYREYSAILALLVAPLPGVAATYQCDNYVITDTPSKYSGCVNIETGEEAGSSDADKNSSQRTSWEGVDRYASVPVMINGLHDFSTKDGTFIVYKENPLYVGLLPRVVKNETSKQKKRVTARALIYGVYRAFAHTPIDRITVEAMPQINGAKLRRYRQKISITRERALRVVKRYASVSRIPELVTIEEIGKKKYRNQWAKQFSEIYYGSATSLQRFVRELNRR